MNFEYLCDKYQLSNIEQNILKYLYDNINNLKKIGIRKVAKDNFTSTTIIYKLCKKLGFEGYSDMIYNISLSNKFEDLESSVDIFTNASNQIELNLVPFSKMLKKCENKLIMLLGVGYSQMIANYMSERFVINGFKCIANTHLQLLSNSHKNDVLLIVISNSGESSSILEITQTAKNNGIEVISFVGNENSTLAKISDLPIVLKGYEKFPMLKNIPNTFFSEVLLLFECFISNID
ncbi:MurR/RpiR family transcriptional regulator [Paraclostridium bifermentans]|uniref:MurR/RpiR family transcriptional regulator n=1 Tax=Paraclostridium bifermentans TaxID=1490 RepID=UPI00359C4CBC